METPQSKATEAGWNFDNSYLTLPGALYAPAKPQKVARPQLIIWNQQLAGELGLALEQANTAQMAELFCGNVLPTGAQPIAQAYAGHQFGHFTMLGDGRALLLGEHIAPDATRWDIQLKGSGQTAFSRRGDGKAALGPMLREYIISEAMHALGIPTTRSLAVVATGEPVYRENILPGAILTRVAQSHIRVGTFEYAATYASQQGDIAILRALADYAMRRHFPDVLTNANPYLAFFEAVAEKQAGLIAQWQAVGFIHGVMNTDNMAIAGETIDYGPCAFMDVFEPATVFSSIDQQGRYAFGNQPRIASWNLARFAETLLSLFDADEKLAIEMGQKALQKFGERFNHHYSTLMRTKLGFTSEQAGDTELVTSLFELMQAHQADYTNTLRTLSYGIPEQLRSAIAMEIHDDQTAPPVMDFHSMGIDRLFAAAEFHSWLSRWQKRLHEQEIAAGEAYARMRQANPVVIPRNHKVEEALSSANAGDLSQLHALLRAVTQPFAETEANLQYRSPGPRGGEPYKTFCGT